MISCSCRACPTAYHLQTWDFSFTLLVESLLPPNTGSIICVPNLSMVTWIFSIATLARLDYFT